MGRKEKRKKKQQRQPFLLVLSSAGTAGAEPPTRADPRRQLPVESGGCGTGAEPRPGSGVRFSGSSGIKPTSELRRTERAGSETHSESPPERGTDLCWSGIPPRKAQPKTPEDRGVIHGARLPLPSGRCPTPQPTQPRRQVRPRLPPCPGSWRLPEPRTCRPQGRGRIEGVRRERRPQTPSTTFSAPGRAGARKAAPQPSTPARLRGDEPERGWGRGRRSGLTAAPANGKIVFAFLLLPARGVIAARRLRARVFPWRHGRRLTARWGGLRWGDAGTESGIAVLSRGWAPRPGRAGHTARPGGEGRS